MSRRLVTGVGLVAAGGVGYYFYQAGGDPKVAQKKAEGNSLIATVDTVQLLYANQSPAPADASKASSEIKSHIPGRGKEAKKDIELSASQAGQQFDNAVCFFAYR